MPRYVIERDIPGAGRLSGDELHAISNKSCDVLRGLGSGIQWDHSYVADDKIYCVYVAENEDLVREHARLGEFPITRISKVEAVIDPVTAEPRSATTATQTQQPPLEMAV